MKIKQRIALLIALACLIGASGCASTKTRTERGVTIEKKRGDIPYVPFF